jgi:hypothetical protein
MHEGIDELPEWEQNLTEDDEVIRDEYAWNSEQESDDELFGYKRERCRICKLPKKLQSTGRCHACQRHHQRHRHEFNPERPLELILKEYRRTLKREGVLE